MAAIDFSFIASFDLEMPLCCDDEYFMHEDPDRAGKQPEDKPSLLSYFIWTLKLTQIQGLALRTLVCPSIGVGVFIAHGSRVVR